MIGRTVSHYRLLDELGRGGMGVVYRAEDTRLLRPVAIKFLHETALVGGDERTRFIHEARAAASLNHPNICTIHEIDEYDGHPFIVMELVVGQSLASIIAEGPLRLDEAVGFAVQIAEGLQEAHRRGIVHRDIKPANIMIGTGRRVKIMDFGLAAAVDQTRLTREGTILGTIAYMSPEQARGAAVDLRTDLWSLGAVAYEMITGRRPFSGDRAPAVAHAILYDHPPPPTAVRTGVPMELDRIVLKALEKRSDERYQHADELSGDLRKLARSLAGNDGVAASTVAAQRLPGSVDGEPDRAAAVSGTAGASAVHGRRRWIVAAAGVVAILVAWFLVLDPLLHEQRIAASPKPIAVIAFDNMTGDPAYDYLSKAIPNLLITSLEQSPYLRVATWERMGDLLRQTGRGDVQAIDRDLGFELCRMDDIDIIVTGSFVKAGDTFVTDVKVLDVRSKALIKSASARGEGAESILERQVDTLSKEIARGIGLSPRRIEQSQRAVAEVTTRSMDAYHYYLRGVEEHERQYYEDARRYLEKAVEIDSTFAVAYMYLASSYGYLRNRALRDEAYEKALQFANGATERERLYIEARHALINEKDRRKYVRLLQELVQRYPREKTARLWLGIDAYTDTRYDDAIAQLREALALDPAYAPALNALAYTYIEKAEYGRALECLQRYAAASPGDADPLDSMAELYFRMGDLARSIAKYKEAIEVKPEFYTSMKKIAYVYGVTGDFDSALVWIDRYIETVPTPGLRMSGYLWQSMMMFLTGRYEAAFADMQRWEDLLGSGSGYQTTVDKYILGNFLCATGHYDRAGRSFAAWKQVLDRSFPSNPKRNEQWASIGRALVLAMSGRADEALAVLDRAEALRAEVAQVDSTAFQGTRSILVLTRGEALLAAGRQEEAIAYVLDHLHVVVPIMGDAELVIHNFPLDGDVIARCYVAMGELSQAAREYRRLFDFEPESGNRRLRNPKYLYRLAQVHEEMGQEREALEKYERFLSYWRNADRDLAEYQDARQRVQVLGAELQGDAAAHSP
jgi:tetratricopeptide (TPR) repeat protein/TolB-like protein